MAGREEKTIEENRLLESPVGLEQPDGDPDPSAMPTNATGDAAESPSINPDTDENPHNFSCTSSILSAAIFRQSLFSSVSLAVL
jgi:hypothetical protein